MTSRCVLKTLLIPLICLLIGGFASATKDVAAVHVLIVDQSGRAINAEPIIEEFRSEGEGPNLASGFRNGVIPTVPFGVYHIKARATGFYSAQRDVRVFQTDVWVVLGLILGMENGPLRYKLVGAVTENERTRPLPYWLRLSGVYSNSIMDTKTDDAGKFAISGIVQGRYVLVTSQDGRVLDVREIDIPTTDHVQIDLK